MNIDYKQFLFACSFAFAMWVISNFIPHEYQFCTGSCTGDLSNCSCSIVRLGASFYLLTAALLGSAYYYLKATPPFFTFLAVVVALLMAVFVAILLFLVLLSMLSSTS
jgi:hypothetical protein